MHAHTHTCARAHSLCGQLATYNVPLAAEHMRIACAIRACFDNMQRACELLQVHQQPRTQHAIIRTIAYAMPKSDAS